MGAGRTIVGGGDLLDTRKRNFLSKFPIFFLGSVSTNPPKLWIIIFDRRVSDDCSILWSILF